MSTCWEYITYKHIWNHHLIGNHLIQIILFLWFDSYDLIQMILFLWFDYYGLIQITWLGIIWFLWFDSNHLIGNNLIVNRLIGNHLIGNHLIRNYQKGQYLPFLRPKLYEGAFWWVDRGSWVSYPTKPGNPYAGPGVLYIAEMGPLGCVGT